MRHAMQNPENYAALWHKMTMVEKFDLMGMVLIKIADNLPEKSDEALKKQNEALKKRVKELNAQVEYLKEKVTP